MSNLIDIIQDAVCSPNAVKEMLKSSFRHKDFNCRNIIDNGDILTFFLDTSKQTYRLSTAWKFIFNNEHFRLEIMFYNSEKSDFLRARTDRMRIELAILARIVNARTMPNFMFVVETQSGALKLVSYQSWPVLYSLTSRKQNIFNLINNFFAQLRKYDELLIFIEPAVFDTRDITQKDKTIYSKINRFRALLKGTRNTRRQIQACFRDLIRFKEQNRQQYRQQYQQVSQLYMKNITAFQKSTYGFENVNEYKIDKSQFQSELRSVAKHNQGRTNFEHGKKEQQKIVFGLRLIKPLEETRQELLSTQGAHSQIYRNYFNYVIAWTINQGTLNLGEQQEIQIRKQMKGELTYKVCHKKTQSSINSFKNQIKALNYLRDKCSPYIAKYFLVAKQTWNENDTIYMANYKQNVHTLLQNYSSYDIKTRLQLAYQIAKGLCFMYSREIAHRDFKPQNIVVDKNLIPKIIDFGSSISHYERSRFTCHDKRLLTTPVYNVQYFTIPAGHQYLHQKYLKEQFDEHPLFDVYGLGRTLSYIFFGSTNPPQPQTFLSEPIFQIMDHLIFLINMCINVDPEDRPSFGQLTAFLGSLMLLIKNDVEQKLQSQ